MRNKTILVSIPRKKQSCLTKFPLQKHESVVRNQRRTQTKKNSVAQKTKKQKKSKTPRVPVNQPGAILKGDEPRKQGVRGIQQIKRKRKRD
jgi:hypothetical protein